MKSIINQLGVFCTMTAVALSACNDSFLQNTPNDRLISETFYSTKSELMAATAPLYNKVWYDFNGTVNIAIGDGRGGNFKQDFSERNLTNVSYFTETALDNTIGNAWKSLFNVVAQSNYTILNIEKYAVAVAEQDRNYALAEARMMRGTAYWYLTSLWGAVPIITDNNKLIQNPMVNTNPVEDVFEFAIRDLEFAAKHLPKTGTSPGRLNYWSAQAMLSRVYLSRSGLGSTDGLRNRDYLRKAKEAAGDVCKNSGLKLMTNYADLFKVKHNNNQESLFALQWVPLGESGVTNPFQSSAAANSTITGDDTGWGQYFMASYNILNTYEFTEDVRRKATFMAKDDYYPEIRQDLGGYTHTSSYANIRKGIVGCSSDNDGKSTKNNTALNTYMIRLAEVYLTYAETILGDDASTTDADALYYFNLVRERAGMDPKITLTFADLFYERRVELCMEGQFWYDIVRRAYYNQSQMIQWLSSSRPATASQHCRGINYSYNNITKKATLSPDQYTKAVNDNPVDPKRFLLPYPESDVIQNPLLKAPPVPYPF